MALPESSNWELCKENVQPLREGRKMDCLSTALQPEELRRSQLEQEMRSFEEDLMQYVGDDPIEPWMIYVKWIEQNYVQGGSRLPSVLQNCIFRFAKEERYKNDPRYLKVWLKFIQTSDKPLEVFNYMHAHHIGIKLADFYNNWALELERGGNKRKADAVFMEGIEREAQPKETLLHHHREFLSRIARTVLLEDERTSEGEEDVRVAFNRLGSNKVGTVRTGKAISASNGQAPKLSLRNSPLPAQPKILPYSDEKDRAFASGPSSEPFVPSAVIDAPKAENEMKPSVWAKAKMGKHGTGAARFGSRSDSLAIKVHEDADDGLPAPTPKKLPSKCVLNTVAPSEPDFIQKAMTNGKVHERPMYCKEKLFQGPVELSFEEVRAARWRRKTQARQEKLRDQERLETLINEAVVKSRDVLFEKLKSYVDQKSGFSQNSTAQEMGNFCSLSKLESLKADSIDFNGKGVNSLPAVSSREDGSVCLGSLGSTLDEKLPSAAVDSERDLEPTVTSTASGDTTNAVMAMWNKSLFLMPQSEELNRTARLDEEMKLKTLFGDHGRKEKPEPLVARKSRGFEIYQDDQKPSAAIPDIPVVASNIPPSASFSHHLGTDVADDRDENVPPYGYIQNKERRTLSGILEPSVGIPFMPLEDVDDYKSEEEDDGTEDEKEYDFTFAPPVNTTLPANSTAICDDLLLNLEFNDDQMQSFHNELFREEGDGDKAGSRAEFTSLAAITSTKQLPLKVKCDTEITQIKPALPTITELSNECYSKSSSSGSKSSLTCGTMAAGLTNTKSNVEVMTNHTSLLRADATTSYSHQAPANSPMIHAAPCSVDPFNIDLIKDFLSTLTLPLCQREGYEELSCKAPAVKPMTNVTFGRDSYLVNKMLGEGAYAKIFKATRETPTNDSAVALKVQKPSCSWEFYICDEISRRLRRLQKPMDVHASVMEISKFYVFSNASVLATTCHQHGTLLDLVNLYKSKGVSMPEGLVMYYAIEILHIVEWLHACLIIHADIKPDNMLLQYLPQIDPSAFTPTGMFGSHTSSLKLIDFGRSIDMSLFPPGTTFTEKVETSGFTCIEMCTDRPWTFQTDYYGVAGTVYCMLQSSYMEVMQQQDGNWMVITLPKRSPIDWKSLFRDLLNVTSCEELLDLSKVRRRLEDEFVETKKYRDFGDKIRELSVMLPRIRKHL